MKKFVLLAGLVTVGCIARGELGTAQMTHKPIRITLTFDDGLKDHLLIAAPELEKRGWRGTFSIVTDWIGKSDKYMTWEDVRELVSRGHEIATHTVSHPALVTLLKEGKESVVRNEIANSRDIIAGKVGFVPRLMCPPYIQYNDVTAALCRKENLRQMDVRRYDFGTGNQDAVVDVLTNEIARGCVRIDLLHHGVSAVDHGGWSPFRDRAAFTRHLDRIANLESRGLVCVTDYEGCAADCALKARSWPHHGVLSLSFDDRHLKSWEAAFPIFARYGATATFCIAGVIDASAVSFAHKALANGHEIALHGLCHRDADTEIVEKGEDVYWAVEMMPQIDGCRKNGIPVCAFAYPDCRHSRRSDALFARHGFVRLRGTIPGVSNPNPHDPNGVKIDKWRPIAEADEFFVPVADHLTELNISNVILGSFYHTDLDDVQRAIDRAGLCAERLSLVSHDISPAADGISIKTDWLERILAHAADAGVVVHGLR